jgi:hypothetical protein
MIAPIYSDYADRLYQRLIQGMEHGAWGLEMKDHYLLITA